MGLNHSLRDGPDSVDVLAVMVAFEEMNQCHLSVVGKLQYTGKMAAMVWTVEATDRKDANAEHVALASRKLSHGFSNPLKMEAVILQLLYGVDADLARRELAQDDKEP